MTPIDPTSHICVRGEWYEPPLEVILIPEDHHYTEAWANCSVQADPALVALIDAYEEAEKRLLSTADALSEAFAVALASPQPNPPIS